MILLPLILAKGLAVIATQIIICRYANGNF